MLPLNFKDPKDVRARLNVSTTCVLTRRSAAQYDKVQPTDKVDLIGVDKLAPFSEVTMVVHHKDGSSEEIPLTHTFNEGQLGWFKAGSALNLMFVSPARLRSGPRADPSASARRGQSAK